MTPSTMQDFPLTIAAMLRHGRAGVRGQRVRHLDRRRRRAARPSPRSATTPTRLAARAARTSASATATGSARSAGTRRSTSRRTSRSRRWARCCTRSTSGCSPSSSPTCQPRRGQGRHRRRLADPGAREGRRRLQTCRALRRGRRRRRVDARVGRTDAEIVRYDDAARRPSRRDFDVARDRRTPGGGDVLHERHDRQPEGRRVLAPFRRTCTRSRSTHAGRARPVASATASSRSCRCSTPTRGASRTPRSSAARSLVMPGRFLQAEPLTRMVKEERRHDLGRGADDLGRHPPLRRGARASTSRRCA